MNILFDQGTPRPLQHYLAEHSVDTASERGWSDLDNGDLLEATPKRRHCPCIVCSCPARPPRHSILGLPPADGWNGWFCACGNRCRRFEPGRVGDSRVASIRLRSAVPATREHRQDPEERGEKIRPLRVSGNERYRQHFRTDLPKKAGGPETPVLWRVSPQIRWPGSLRRGHH